MIAKGGVSPCEVKMEDNSISYWQQDCLFFMITNVVHVAAVNCLPKNTFGNVLKKLVALAHHLQIRIR